MPLTEKLCYGVNCRGLVNQPIALFEKCDRYPDGYARKCQACLAAEAEMVDSDRRRSGQSTGAQWALPTSRPGYKPPSSKFERPERKPQAPVQGPAPAEAERSAERLSGVKMSPQVIDSIDAMRQRKLSWREIGDEVNRRNGWSSNFTAIRQQYYILKRKAGESVTGADPDVALPAASEPEPSAPSPSVSEPEPESDAARSEVSEPEPDCWPGRELTTSPEIPEQVAPPAQAPAAPPEYFSFRPAPADRVGCSLLERGSSLSEKEAGLMREAAALFDERARRLEVEAAEFRSMARRARELVDNGKG